MSAIKIDFPIKENMEYSLNESECDALIEKVQKLNESDEAEIRRVIREESDPNWLAMGLLGGATVLYLIASLIKWIKNKYRLTVQKMYDQAKELNDIYTKVSDLLANDKMARFKHRNDIIDKADVEYIVMRDKRDPRKFYQLIIDYCAYDPQYFIDEINDIIRYVDTESKNKKADLKTMTDALLEKIEAGFQNNHGFLEYCEPVMKIETYKNIKLEKLLTIYKNWVNNIYTILYMYNKYVASELQYLQLLQQAYQRMLKDYGSNKENKELVDKVFKKLIKNVTLSMDFNAKSVDILNVMIRFYADELKKIYDRIRDVPTQEAADLSDAEKKALKTEYQKYATAKAHGADKVAEEHKKNLDQGAYHTMMKQNIEARGNKGVRDFYTKQAREGEKASNKDALANKPTGTVKQSNDFKKMLA